MRKLTFLVKLLQPTNDVCRISLVQQCQLLELDLGTSIVTQCLNEPENAITILQEAREAVVSRDWEIVLEIAKCRKSTKHISHPQIASSWCKLWDLALDHGVCGTRQIQHLLRVMSRPVFGKRECPICNQTIHEDTSYFEHMCVDHCYSGISVEGVMEDIGEDDLENILTIATTLLKSL